MREIFYNWQIADIKQTFQNNCFSAAHLNIRSLSANFDEFCVLLADLEHNFDLIGLSETKIKKDVGETANTIIAGYDFISQPTFSNAGGVSLYVKQGLRYHSRDDLSSVTKEFETLWIEINNNCSKNIICGVIYRHPNGKVEKFNEHLFSVIDRISKEKKNYVFLWGISIKIF